MTAEKILIAAGSRPKIPDIEGLNNTSYLTSDDALRLTKQPKILTIIGGGYIACELAHFFGSLGTDIHIIQHKDRLIPSEDQDVSKKITELYSKKYNLLLDKSYLSGPHKHVVLDLYFPPFVFLTRRKIQLIFDRKI